METGDAVRSRRNVREHEQRPNENPDRRPFDDVVHRGRW